jgi:hypothetical protein
MKILIKYIFLPFDICKYNTIWCLAKDTVLQKPSHASGNCRQVGNSANQKLISIVWTDSALLFVNKKGQTVVGGNLLCSHRP